MSTDKLNDDYQRVIEFLRGEIQRNRDFGRHGFAKVYAEHEEALVEYRRVMENSVRAHQASVAALERVREVHPILSGGSSTPFHGGSASTGFGERDAGSSD